MGEQRPCPVEQCHKRLATDDAICSAQRRTEMPRSVLCPRFSFLFRPSPCITAFCFGPFACLIRREQMASMYWRVTTRVSKDRCVLRTAAAVSFACVNFVVLCLVGLRRREAWISGVAWRQFPPADSRFWQGLAA